MPRRSLLALAIAAPLLLLHALSYLPWTEDDAGITLRYAANLADGRGLVYNPGERVEAISNLGYALLLTPVYALLPGSDPRPLLLLPAKLLGLAAAAAGLLELLRLARSAGLGERGCGAVLVLAGGSSAYAAWAVGALETPFVAWASLALVAAAAEIAAGEGDGAPAPRLARRRAALAAASLVLLRVDGFVLPVAIGFLLALSPRTRREALEVAAAAAAGFAAVLAFRLLYYGRAWPNPVYAKVELERSLAEIATTYRVYIGPFLRLHGGAIPLAVAAAVACLGKDGPARARRVAAAAAVATLAYTTAVGGDWMPLHRFCVPAVGPLVVCAAHACGRLGSRLRLRPSLLIVLALALGAASAEALAGRALFRTRRAAPLFWLDARVSPEALHQFWLPAVRRLRAIVPRDGLLVTSEAGFIPYLTDLRTIDSYGLATRAIADLPRGSVERSSLGVLARFTEGPPRDPAELVLASAPADAVVLQAAMVAGWNAGMVPDSLFAGRFVRDAVPTEDGRWAVYLPVSRRGSAPR